MGKEFEFGQPHLIAAPSPLPVDLAAVSAEAADAQPGLRRFELAAPGLAAAFLAACGGGGGAPSPGASSPVPQPPASPPPPVSPPPPAPVTAAEAARFLGQAAFGGTDALIADVQTRGYVAWIDAQLALPRSQGHFDWMTERGYAVDANRFSTAGVDNTQWRKLMSSPDSLRQRVVLALSEIFVISSNGLPVSWPGMIAAAYLDVLESNAFGTYRKLLEDVTLSAGMGVYLNMRGNQKADGRGREPDENYAREVLQLFSLGVNELNQDGTPKMVGDKTVDTYDQASITGLARVFTGWDYDAPSSSPSVDVSFTRRPMVPNASRHAPEAKTFLGVTIPGATATVASANSELKTALDTIAAHPNVGPYIGRQLIQRLVASNPSPAYVGRVAAAFANNGAGVRGDMRAVIKAVLLDPEARSLPSGNAGGKLREPIVRFLQWGRTFGAASPTGVWNVGDTTNPSTRLGQSPLRSPSVFNFFRPGYVPPNSALGNLGITAPEFQIINESSVVGYVNWMQGVIQNGVGEVRADYTALVPLANDPGALFDKLNLWLSANQLSAATRTLVVGAVTAMTASTDAQRLLRVNAAVLMCMAAPEYIAQK